MVANLAIQNSSDHVGGWAMNDNNAKSYFQPLPSADSYNKGRLEGDYKENEPSYGQVNVSPPPNLNMDFLGNIVSNFVKNETYKPNSFNQNRLTGNPEDQFSEPAPNPGRAPIPIQNVPFPHKKYLERIQKAGQSIQYLARVAGLAGDAVSVGNYGQIFIELNNMINVINYRILNVGEQKRLSEIEKLIYIALNNLPANAPPPAPGGMPFVPGGGPPGGGPGGDGGAGQPWRSGGCDGAGDPAPGRRPARWHRAPPSRLAAGA